MSIFSKGKFSPTRYAKNRGKTKGKRYNGGSQFKGSGVSHSVRYGRATLIRDGY